VHIMCFGAWYAIALQACGDCGVLSIGAVIPSFLLRCCFCSSI
jgi:hypothetical protein